MVYQPLRKFCHGDIITAADLNAIVYQVEAAHERVDAQPTPEPAASSLPTLAAIAAVASASTKPISRRALFGLRWKR